MKADRPTEEAIGQVSTADSDAIPARSQAGHTVTPAELASVLSAVDCAYEAAHHLADVGRLNFGPFEGLPRALRILRDVRDRRAA